MPKDVAETALIDEFVRSYEREIDFYASVARLGREILEDALIENGIRAIVTGRAKRPDSLRKKLLGRAAKFTTVQEIREDIVDFAGIRVALYFPGQRDLTSNLIQEVFAEDISIEFPKPERRHPKAFPGYVAIHHRVHLREGHLSLEQKRYASARIEIQVASVLMHAWAEVEHDFAYKPESGDLSPEERAILDQLNGLVLSGEHSLELLQSAFERRVHERDRRFLDHYDLAAVLSRYVVSNLGMSATEKSIGRSDELLTMLRGLGIDTPGALAPVLNRLRDVESDLPIAQRVMNAIIGTDLERNVMLESIRLSSGRNSKISFAEEAKRRFLRAFQILESRVRSAPDHSDYTKTRDRFLALRNLALHGRALVSLDLLSGALSELERIGIAVEEE